MWRNRSQLVSGDDRWWDCKWTESLSTNLMYSANIFYDAHVESTYIVCDYTNVYRLQPLARFKRESNISTSFANFTRTHRNFQRLCAPNWQTKIIIPLKWTSGHCRINSVHSTREHSHWRNTMQICVIVYVPDALLIRNRYIWSYHTPVGQRWDPWIVIISQFFVEVANSHVVPISRTPDNIILIFFYIVVWVDTFHTHEQSTKQRHAFIVIIHNIMTRRRQRSRTRNLSVNTQAWPYAYAQNNAYVDKKIIISLSIPPLGTHTFRCAHLEDVDTSAQFMRFRRLTCISKQIHDCIKFSFGITKSLINMAEICS